MASKYDSIWLALKINGEVKLAVHPALQKRVIKGVIHCKDHDLARKLALANNRRKEKISYEQTSSMVIIKLKQYVNMNNLSLAEL